jgi:hypothetical protein
LISDKFQQFIHEFSIYFPPDIEGMEIIIKEKNEIGSKFPIFGTGLPKNAPV